MLDLPAHGRPSAIRTLAAIIVSVVLYMMGTSVVKGFAITFFLGCCRIA
jgi:preprotein translocase subunit SecD